MYYVVATLSVTTCWGNYMKYKVFEERIEKNKQERRESNSTTKLEICYKTWTVKTERKPRN